MADRRRPNRTPGRGRGARLDQPREFRRRDFLPGPGFSQESFGVWSEQFARFMGTPLFLIGLTAFAVIWIGWNTWAPAASASSSNRVSSVSRPRARPQA